MTLEAPEQSSTTEIVPAAEQRAVLVLGMHRGGTSALAGLLHLSGFDLGHSLMEPAAGVNDKGFWEHTDVHAVHERLLASLGRSRFDPREMPAGWRTHPAFAVAVDEVRTLILRDFAHARYWAIKDPRMCRVVPVWIEAMATMGITPRVVVIVRHPSEVARSMQAQRWIASSARAHLCWLQHMLEAEEATRGVVRTLLTYDTLLEDWRAARACIGRELELDWPAVDAKAEQAIDEFLDAGERHFRDEAQRATMHDAQVPALALDLFAACRAGVDVWPRFAAVCDEFRRGAAAFAPCLDEAIVEASLAFIEAGQGRLDAATRGERAAELEANIVASLDALRDVDADTTRRLQAIEGQLAEVRQNLPSDEARTAIEQRLDASHAAISARIDAIAEHAQNLRTSLASLDATANARSIDSATSLASLGASLAGLAEKVESLRAEQAARFSFSRWWRGRAR